MKSHLACIAFLITGILFCEGPLRADSTNSSKPLPRVVTNRTDSAAGSGLHSGAATNAPATDKQLHAIEMQRELLDALSAQLNQLLTKYTENDKRVRATRRQIADVQKQLAKETADILPTGGSGANRTARASNATAETTNAPANGSSVPVHGANTIAQAASGATNTNTKAPTVGPNSTAATDGSNTMNKATDATKTSSKAKNTKTADATAKASAVTSNGTNTTTSTNLSVKLVSMDTLDDTYHLAIGDKLSFRIEEDKNRLDPADKQNVRTEDDPTPLLVADSGELEVPYIGRFPAEYKTCKQLAYELKAALEKDYFFKATVILAVDLKAKSLGRVYLTGAVHTPGPEDIPSDETLTLGKAILRAGGFTDFAERHNVKVTRKAAGSSQIKTVVVDVAQVFDKGKTDLDLPLQPGDLILVPERLIRF